MARPEAPAPMMMTRGCADGLVPGLAVMLRVLCEWRSISRAH
jgi:hypothetical protein